MNRKAEFLWTALLLALLAGCTQPGSNQQETEPERREVPIVFSDVTEPAGLVDFRHETGEFGEKWFPETMGPGEVSWIMMEMKFLVLF